MLYGTNELTKKRMKPKTSCYIKNKTIIFNRLQVLDFFFFFGVNTGRIHRHNGKEPTF